MARIAFVPLLLAALLALLSVAPCAAIFYRPFRPAFCASPRWLHGAARGSMRQHGVAQH